MSRSNEDAAKARFPSPHRDVAWKNRGWVADALSFSGLGRDCAPGLRIFPDLHAVVGDEMWVVEIENTHPTSPRKLREWGYLLDSLMSEGDCVFRLFVWVDRLACMAEIDLGEKYVEFIYEQVTA